MSTTQESTAIWTEMAEVAGLDATARVALLLAALTQRCEQWALVQATAVVVRRPVDVGVLDRLVALGLAVVDHGWVEVPDDDVRRVVTSSALPSQVQQAHLALAGQAPADAVSRGWHLTHAATAPSAEAADLALETAHRLQSTGRSGSARVMLEQAARLAPSAPERAERFVEAGVTAFAMGFPKQAQRLLDAAHDAGTDATSELVARVVTATFTTGEIPRSVDHAGVETVLDRLRACGLGPVAFSVLLAAGDSSVTARYDDLPSATRHLRELADELSTSGLRGVETHARALLADSSARTGDLSNAADQARRVRELAWMTRQPSWQARSSLTEALVAALRGTPDAPQLVDDVHRDLLCEHGEPRLLIELAHAVAFTSVELWGDAFAIMTDLADQATAFPALLELGLLGHLADAARHTGRPAEAREVISRIARSSAACEHGSGLVDVLYATALLAPGEESEACLEVVQALSPASWPWVRARSDLARGAVLRRRRRSVEARAHLLSAQRLFRAMGAPVWERRALDELRAAGWRDPRQDGARVATGWNQLSPQEQEVVRLAAEGLTNRQIGERLFLSPRTIGAHLYHVFPKLDVTSRTQLARLELPNVHA